jgi:hypothetical protein
VIYTPGGRLKVHEPSVCEGTHCAIHNPSDHHMTAWPLNIRLDRWDMLGERMCEHGIGHPDPDSLRYIEEKYQERMAAKKKRNDEDSGAGVHGCDGCCRVEK